MPRDEQHRAKAKQNEDFAASLDVTHPVHDNWAVVAAFYSALHYVESCLAAQGKASINHEDRDQKIKGHPRLRDAYSHYKFLYELSRDARYRCGILQADSYLKKAKPRLDHVRGYVNNIMGVEAARATAPVHRPVLPPEDARPMPGKPAKT